MILGIDASNLRRGGGLTHLKEILNHFEPEKHLSIEKIVLFGGAQLRKIEERNWLEKCELPSLDKNFIIRSVFKQYSLKRLIAKKTDFVWAPGGYFVSKRIPYITMSRNMLVFENKERDRFKYSFTWFRYLFLEYLQMRSFNNAAGIIFISHYAKNFILKKTGLDDKTITSKTIYHGISDVFRNKPEAQKEIEYYTANKPLKILYVSIINYYKHQFNVIEAVKLLVDKGYPIQLILAGNMYKGLKKKFDFVLKENSGFVKHFGPVPFEDMSELYQNADLFLYASTCENMPNVLVESMSAGLPIACSNFGPMPEILNDAGIYFNPLDIKDIAKKLENFINDKEARNNLSNKSYERSFMFSWKKCAYESFTFIEDVYKRRDKILRY